MPYLDLEYELRTNGQFRHRLIQLSQKLDDYHKKAREHSSYVKRYNDALYEFMKLCNFNLVLLSEHYFPKFPKDKPLNFADYPFAFQMFNFQIGGFNVFRASRQISKSTSLTARQLFNAHMLPGFASLYICPRLQQLETYQNRLREIHMASRFYHDDPRYRTNLRLKEFPNKSRIELVYVLTSSANARSKSADEILYDEFQDFDPDLELEVDQCQRASHTPVTIYAGTSLTTETALEYKFANSSQAYWLTKCPSGHDNLPIPDMNVMDQIQPKGPSCYKCGKILNVRSGRFVHTNQQMFQLGKRGFHIPQIIVPAVVYHERRWADIYEKKLKMNTRQFYQEILGIPTEEGEREITKKHLIDICTLGRNINRLHEHAANGKYIFVVSGCDWGGSDYNPAENIKVSTTVHCMMGITSTGEFHILHFRRYSGMDYDDISGNILYNHQKLSAFALASDFGVGAVYNSALRKVIPPERHLIFGYTGPQTDLISEPKKSHMYNQWSLNKSESISMTYDAIRKKRIRCYDWDFASEYLLDALNMYRAPAEKKGETGMTQWMYRSHPSKPNDALQAMNYCFILGKILLGEPMFSDMSLKVRLDNIMGGVSLNQFFAGSGMSEIGAFSG